MRSNSGDLKIGHRRRRRWCKPPSVHLLVALAGVAAFAPPALAAPPAAGTVIGNQAVATFESGGQTFSVTSNLVQTTVNTVAGVSIETDTTKSAVAGGKVYFPHTVTNVGNAADIYDLTASDPGTGLSVSGIYADGNCDGVPDTASSISRTASLDPGESACVVIEVDIASGTTGSPTFKITAASTQTEASNFEAGTPNTPNDSNTDTVNVTTGAVFRFTKSMALLNDADRSDSPTPGDTVRVRFDYSNIGGVDAANVAVTDGLPNELVYVANSGTWSDGGTMTDTGGDTDHTNGQNHSISYVFDAATVGARISSVPVGRTGYIEFDATIAANAAGTISNTGTIDSDQTEEQESNEARLVVDNDAAIAVTLADTAAADPSYEGRPETDLPDGNYAEGAPTSTTDDDTLANDRITHSSPYVSVGSSVPFEVIITNHSNAAQRFDISTDRGSFPAGTTFSVTTASGAAILDTTSDGRPDIQVGANSVSKFFVRANLPPASARIRTDSAWEATVTARAVDNASVVNSTRLALAGDVGGGTVDLQNDNGKAGGSNVDNEGNPWTVLDADPGETAQFTLVVVNKRAVADSFNLAFSNTNGPFAPGQMPSGWQVVFKDPSGGTVANTGVIAAGASATFTAHVTPPASASPGSTDIYFRATSATLYSETAESGEVSIVDTKLDRVTVNQIVDLDIRSDQVAQAAPGGVVTMNHTLENVGNVAISKGPIAYDPAFPTFAETLWFDANGNAVLDESDKAVADIADIVGSGSLAPGDKVLLFSRVQVPSGAAAGSSESANVVVSSSLTAAGGGSVNDRNPSNNSVSETVTVASGNVVVMKEQAIDATCDGTADGSFSQAGQTADPGQCIAYRITATNMGTANAESLRIDDKVPDYTTYVASSAPTGGSSPAIAIEPAAGATGDIRSTHGTLAPGQSAQLIFRVKIDQ